MAVRYYGINLGASNPAGVTIAASTTSSDVEVAVDDTNIARAGVDSKEKILRAMEALEVAIAQDQY